MGLAAVMEIIASCSKIQFKDGKALRDNEPLKLKLDKNTGLPNYNKKMVCQAPALFISQNSSIPAIIRCYDSNSDAGPYETISPGIDVIEYSIACTTEDGFGIEIVNFEILGVIIDLDYDGIADIIFLRDQDNMNKKLFRTIDIRYLDKNMKSFKLTEFNVSDYGS